MLRAANCLAGLYSEVISRDLLLAGTLLRDFGKEKEFLCSELGLVTDCSIPGKLLGHLYRSSRAVERTKDSGREICAPAASAPASPRPARVWDGCGTSVCGKRVAILDRPDGQP